MQVTLISPYLEIYSVGLRIISSVLKKEGFSVRMLFLPQDFHCSFSPENLDEISNLAKDSALVGISLMSNQVMRSIQITKAIKSKTAAPVIWGGIHPTACPENSLEYADGICIGEGEGAMLDLAKRIRNAEDIFTTKNFWFKTNGKTIKNEIRTLTANLDSFPYPDYAYKEQFLFDDSRVRRFDERYFKKHLSTTYLTLSSRGCPYRCAYCCNNVLNKMYSDNNSPLYRRRSLKHLIGELSWVKKEIPFVKRICFEDDLFLATSEANIKEFCESYSKQIALPFTIAGITPTTINENKLNMLLDAGLSYVRMGIQTASPRLAKILNRTINKDMAFDTIKLFNRYKKRIKHPYYDFILDTPWETADDKIETLQFLARIPKPYKMNLFSMTFYPGTELYDRARAEGILKDDFRQVYNKNYTFLEHTYPNALFYILYCNSILPLVLKELLLNKKLIMFFDGKKTLSKFVFLIAKAQYLLIEALKDIFSGKLWRIVKFFQLRKFNFRKSPQIGSNVQESITDFSEK